jgi:tape measure domain-containing protein
MAVELATAYVSIVPSARGFGRNLSRTLEGEMGDTGAALGDRVSSQFGSRLTAGVSQAAKAAAVGLGALGAAASTYGIKIASQNEQAAISFETLLGSADAANSLITDMKKFAAKTPFEFGDLQKAAGSLLTTGVSAEKIIPIMTTLGDVTSGMGTGAEGVKRATVALQQMNAAGRIMGQDLNQLRDAGIPVYDLLAAATGKTKEEISAMAQAGKLGRKELDQLMKALETGAGLERFTGLMEKQSQSLLGLWSTLKDELGQGLADAMAPAVVAIKQQLPTITDAITATLVTAGPALTDVVTGLVGLLGQLAPLAAPLLADFGRLVADGLQAIAPIIADMMPFLAFLARVLANEIGGAVVELIPEMGALLRALGPLAVLVVRLAIAGAQLLAPALSAIIRAVTPLVGLLATGLSVAFDQLATMDVSGVFDAVATSVSALATAAVPLANVFMLFATDVGAALVDMMPSLVTGFIGLLDAVIPLIPEITRLALDILPVAVELFRALAPDAIRLAAVMLPLWVALFRLKAVWNDMLFRVIEPFLPVLIRLAETLLPAFEKAVVPIVEAFANMVSKLSETKGGMILLAGAMAGVMALKFAGHLALMLLPGRNVFGMIQLVSMAIRGMATAEAEAAAGSSAFGIIKAALISAANATWLMTAAQTALAFVMSPWFYIPVAIAAVVALGLALYQTWQPFHDLVDSLWDSFQVGIEWVKQLAGLLLGGDFTKAGELVSDMGGRIVDGLAALGTTIRDKVGEWALAALEGLKTFGSLVVGFLANTVLPAIANVLLSYARLWWWWITQAIPNILLALGRIYLALAVWLYTTVLPWLLSAGRDLLVAFVGWIKEAVPAALEALGGWLQALGAWFTGTAVPWLSEQATALATALWAWAQEAIPPLLAQLGVWLAALGSWITGTALPWLADAAVGLGGALLSWLVDVVPKLLVGLARIIVAFTTWYYGTAVPWLLRAGVALLGALLHFIQEAPGWIADGFTFILGSLGGWIATAAVWLADEVMVLGAALWGWIAENAPIGLAKLGEWLAQLGGWIVGTGLPWLGNKIAELAGALWGWIAEAVPGALAALGGWLQSIGVWIAETAVPWLISKGASLLVAMLLWAVKLTLEMPLYLARLIVAIGTWVAGAAVWLAEKALELGKAFLGWLVRLPVAIPLLLAKGLEVILGWIVGTAVPWILEKAVELFHAITNWIVDAVIALPGLLWGFALAIGGWIVNTAVPWLVDQARNLMGAIMGWLTDAINAAPGKLAEWGDAILGFIRGLPQQIADAARGMFVGIANAFIAAINWIIRTWNDLRLELPEIEILGQKVGGFTLESINVTEVPSISGFAGGGRPPTGRPALVGELGPELFVPDRLGTIVPNDALAASRGGMGLNIGKVEISGQDKPAETAFSLRSELAWLSMVAGGT